jgi:hypothetical protein
MRRAAKLIIEQDSFVIKVSFCVFLILVSSCQNEDEAKKKEQHVRNLIEYVKSQPIDSTVFTQPFLTERLRSKKSSYDLYLGGLLEMKIHLRKNDPIRMDVDKEDGDVYFLSTSDSTHLFFRVKVDGVDSFIPFFKGKKIVGWM